MSRARSASDQLDLFGFGDGELPCAAPVAVSALRGAEIVGRRGGRVAKFGTVRADGVYQRGVDGIKHVRYKGDFSFGVDEWDQIVERGVQHVITVDNETGDWWYCDIRAVRAFRLQTENGPRRIVRAADHTHYRGNVR